MNATDLKCQAVWDDADARISIIRATEGENDAFWNSADSDVETIRREADEKCRAIVAQLGLGSQGNTWARDPRKDTNVTTKIDDFTFTDANLWKHLSAYPGISETIIASACGWKNATKIQFGNIFNRLNELGDEKTYTALKNAVRWHNAD